MEVQAMAFTFIPEWAIQDILIYITATAIAIYVLNKEEKPSCIFLECLSFCFLYAAVYENFAVVMGWYAYGESILMIGKVPFSVPLVEYLVVYGALRLAKAMRMPGWARPLFVGFQAMIFDFSLDPIAVKLIRDMPGGQIGRWTWYPGAADAQIMGEPVYNFTGWVLLAGWAAAFILLGRHWWEKSGKKDYIAILYPILGMLAALLLLVSPLSQFILWLAPFFGKGSAGEWIMLALHSAIGLGILLIAWRGRMLRGAGPRAEWPAYLVLGGFHLLDIAMCLLSGHFEVLPLVLGASILQWAILAWIYMAGRKSLSS
jgi:hypothetical protein